MIRTLGRIRCLSTWILEISTSRREGSRMFSSSYHTGSLAFGSLILAVVQMVRIVLEYLDHKLKGELQHVKHTGAVQSLG